MSQITYLHGGSVNRAAASIGISQPSLRDLAQGRTTPRTRTLEKIAKIYGGSLDWWLSGTGSAPARSPTDDVEPWDELLQWAELLDSLDLPPLTAEAVEFLPYGVRSGGLRLPRSGPMTEKVKEFVRETLRQSLRTWILWLSGLIELYGAEAVRKELERTTVLAALGYTSPGRWLVDEGKVSIADIRTALTPTTSRRAALRTLSRVDVIRRSCGVMSS